MRPMVLLVLSGCLDSTAEPMQLHGLHALDGPQALLIPCETPSGQRAALGVLRGDTCGDTAPRSCRAWRELLQHRFACQPGVSPNADADAVVFWLEGAEASDLTGAVVNHIERQRCGGDSEPLFGEARVTRGGSTPLVDFDVDGLIGSHTFRACL